MGEMKRSHFLTIYLGSLLAVILVVLSSASDMIAATNSTNHSLFLPIVATNLPVIIPETTHPLSEATTKHLVSISEDNAVLTFDQTSAELMKINPGDIVVTGVSDTAPYGFLREVSSLSQTNGKIIITTIPTTLEDAIEQGEFNLSVALKPENNSEIALAEDVVVRPFAHASGEEGWNVDLIDVPLGCLRASGSISISNIELDVGGEFQGHSLRQFRAVVTTKVKDDLVIEVVCEEDALDIETVVLGPLHLTPIVVPVGPVPIVITPLIDLTVGAKGTPKFGASVAAQLEVRSKTGPIYSEGDFDFIGDFEFDATWGDIQPKVGLDLKAFAGPEYSFLLYGSAGAYARVGPFVEGEVDVLAPELWRLYRGIEAPVGLELNMLGKEIDNYEAIAIEYRELWKQGSTESPNVEFVGHIDIPAKSVTETGDLLFVGSEDNLIVFDISTRAQPSLLGQTESLGAPILSIGVSNNFAYLAAAQQGLLIVDLSYTSSPKLIETYKANTYSTNDVALNQGLAYIANDYALDPINRSDEIEILDVGNPYSVQKRGGLSFCLSCYASSIIVHYPYAYYTGGMGAHGSEWLGVLNITEPNLPKEVGSFSFNSFGYPIRIAMYGNLAFVAEFNEFDTVSQYYGGGVRVLNLADPANPYQVSYYNDTFTEATDITIKEQMAFVTDQSNGFRLIDISSLYPLREIGYYNTPGSAQGLAVSENFVYVADGNSGLYILCVPHSFFPDSYNYAPCPSEGSDY